jgi:cytoskeletal protein RodZ
MSKKFDPYFEWLKIPPIEQPPNHYRLLSTARFESDPDVIEAAVNRLVAKLQNLSNGPRVDDAQRLLNDVAKARLCLSDPKRKAEYDANLRKQLESKKKSLQPVPKQRPKPAPSAANTRKPAKSRTQPKSSTRLLIGYAAAIVVIALGAVAVLYQHYVTTDSPSVAQQTNSENSTVSSKGVSTPLDSAAGHSKDNSNQLDSTNNENPTDESSASENPAQAAKPAVNSESANNAAVEPDNRPTMTNPETTVTPATETVDDSVLRPAELERGESMMGEFVEFEGLVVMASQSRSGKTRYLRFSQDWNQSIMIFMLTREVGETLTLADLKQMAGKKVRASGVVEREFGSNRIGVKIKSKDQLEVVNEGSN